MGELQTIETAVETEFATLENDAVNVVEGIAGLFSADVWPFVKAGVLTLLTVAGQAAVKAEVIAIPAELSGNVAAAAAGIGAAITGAVTANAGTVLDTETANAVAAVEADQNATDAEKAVVHDIGQQVAGMGIGSDAPGPSEGLPN